MLCFLLHSYVFWGLVVLIFGKYHNYICCIIGKWSFLLKVYMFLLSTHRNSYTCFFSFYIFKCVNIGTLNWSLVEKLYLYTTEQTHYDSIAITYLIHIFHCTLFESWFRISHSDWLLCDCLQSLLKISMTLQWRRSWPHTQQTLTNNNFLNNTIDDLNKINPFSYLYLAFKQSFTNITFKKCDYSWNRKNYQRTKKYKLMWIW
jgi:hypothetical protein